jgi:3-deoxy-D-manno-octulosonic-acid transferase
MSVALDLLYLAGFVLASPWLAWRYLRRRGSHPPDAEAAVPPPRGAIWLHGSSVGEVSLLKPLIERLVRERPGVPLAISSHTITGVASARRAYPGHHVFRFPPDFSFTQRRLMARLAPRLIVVAESDLWPNHLLAAERLDVPVAVVNAKLSERSFRLHRLSRIVPRALRQAALVAAQTEAHAARFAALGVPRDRIAVTGNMKYDLAADRSDAAQRVRLRQQLGFAEGDVVIIGGSLHPREDVDLIAAYAATRGQGVRTRLVIVPRYPEQAQDVIGNAVRAGCGAVARSELGRRPGREHGKPGEREAVIVVDTLGELRELYAAADIAFVGGSLYYRGANKGGHNLMEPAILGLPVLFGPHNFSFRETVADLLAADAGVEVADRDGLTTALAALLASAERRAELGARARAVVLEGQGAAARNLELLLPLVDDARSCGHNHEAPQCPHQTLKSSVE